MPLGGDLPGTYKAGDRLDNSSALQINNLVNAVKALLRSNTIERLGGCYVIRPQVSRPQVGGNAAASNTVKHVWVTQKLGGGGASFYLKCKDLDSQEHATGEEFDVKVRTADATDWENCAPSIMIGKIYLVVQVGSDWWFPVTLERTEQCQTGTS